MNLEHSTQADSKPCPYCGEMIKTVARKCRHCREYLDEDLKSQNRIASASSTTDRFLMPVDRPLSAIAAGYLGLFSVLPLFGIPAFAVGLYALSVLKKNPELTGRGRAIFGIAMGSIFTLFYAFMIVMIASSH